MAIRTRLGARVIHNACLVWYSQRQAARDAILAQKQPIGRILTLLPVNIAEAR